MTATNILSRTRRPWLAWLGVEGAPEEAPRTKVPLLGRSSADGRGIVDYTLAVHWQFRIMIFGPVFGRFSAKLGPKTPLE